MRCVASSCNTCFKRTVLFSQYPLRETSSDIHRKAKRSWWKTPWETLGPQWYQWSLEQWDLRPAAKSLAGQPKLKVNRSFGRTRRLYAEMMSFLQLSPSSAVATNSEIQRKLCSRLMLDALLDETWTWSPGSPTITRLWHWTSSYLKSNVHAKRTI